MTTINFRKDLTICSDRPFTSRDSTDRLSNITEVSVRKRQPAAAGTEYNRFNATSP